MEEGYGEKGDGRDQNVYSLPKRNERMIGREEREQEKRAEEGMGENGN